MPEDDPAFEKQAEQAETEAALDKELEGTFPTSDPPSSWAGPDTVPERPEPEESSESLMEGVSAPQPGSMSPPESPTDAADEPILEVPDESLIEGYAAFSGSEAEKPERVEAEEGSASSNSSDIDR
jgi:hypothetical protein